MNARTHLVDQRSVNVPVSNGKRMLDGVLDLSRFGLPCAETDGGDGGARVKGEVGGKSGADGHCEVWRLVLFVWFHKVRRTVGELTDAALD